MIYSETSLWNDSIQPRVRRNQPGNDVIIVDLTGQQLGPTTARLIASNTARARELAEKLRQTAAALDAMADVVDTPIVVVESADGIPLEFEVRP